MVSKIANESKVVEPPKKAKSAEELWDYYHVKLKIRDRLVGGYPKNPQAEEAMLRARGLEDLIPPQVDPATLTEEQRETLKQTTVEKSWTGFKADENGPYLEARCVKAMFKEAANILKGPQILDVKNFKSKLAERLFVEPNKIHLEGRPIIDGTDQRVVHVMTMMGARS